jgi:hypothetical protein
LKWIVFCAAGYDIIDVNACAARKIMVSHTPTAVDSVSMGLRVRVRVCVSKYRMIYLTCFTSFYGQIYRLLLILLRY